MAEKLMCPDCVRNEQAKRLALSAVNGRCDYCEKETKVIPFFAFFDSVLGHFHRNYRPDLKTDDERRELQYWPASAKTLLEIVQEDVNPVSMTLASDLVNALISNLATRKYEDPGNATFRKWNPSGEQFRNAWDDMCKSLDTTRYFNNQVSAMLNSAFGDIATLRTKGGLPLIISVNHRDRLAHLYRARVFQEKAQLEEAFRGELAKELGPPPKQKATPGRMNPRGISVFYGATREDVAIAEVRPSVGSFVAIGEFALLKSMRLLDLTRFEDLAINEPPSFDIKEWVDADRKEFVRKLNSLLSQPVMPNNEEGYLITQIISDYLATHRALNIDGIVFPSVQLPWVSNDPPLNVVLFNKAVRVRTTNNSKPWDTLLLKNSYVKKIVAATYHGGERLYEQGING